MLRGWRIAAMLVAFFTFVGGLAYLAMRERPVPPRQPNLKRLTGTIAEGLVYQASGERFPRASCDACRVVRKKIGVLTLGAFCALEFDNLVVNLPPGDAKSVRDESGRDSSSSGAAGCRVNGNAKDTPRQTVDSLAERLGLRSLAQASGSRRIPNVSGLSVRGFKLNRMDGSSLHSLCSAARLQTKGREIEMLDVTIWRNEAPEHLPSATLRFGSCPALIWPGGEWAFNQRESPLLKIP